MKFPLNYLVPGCPLASVLKSLCVIAICSVGEIETPAAQNTTQASPNRTLPKVEPPRSGLAFSAQPTVQEISRAGAFQEPLVPIGGQPGADENAALASALLGYAKRSGPDDFASLTAFLEKYPNSPWRAA